ncbi:MAG: aminoglycoside phosphotransferase family protein [Actinomycetota bacterium]
METSVEGRDWLARLPGLADDCAEQWSLTLGEPFTYAFASLALPATREDGSAAVLKIQFPDRESEHEAAALKLIGGDGAVRLIAYDVARRALLLERADPGTPLKELEPDRALDVFVDLLPRLWKPADAPFRPLADEAAWWAGSLPDDFERAGRPFERALLDAALEAIERLSGSQGEQVLVNQDMHADNVIRAEREPWLLIDPKPLAGEREFGIAATVRGRELGHSREAVVHRLDRLTGELQLDRERARGWTLAQTIAWAFDGDEADPVHVEIARWLWEAGR